MTPSHRLFLAPFVFVLSLFLPSALYSTLNIDAEGLSKSVVFIYGANADGTVNEGNPMGTGFIVQIPVQSDPSRSYGVLVTARHMVDAAWRQCSSLPLTTPEPQQQVIYVRFNKKNYDPKRDLKGVDFSPIPLFENGKPRWMSPTEDDADVAVFFLNAKFLLDNFDVASIPIFAFATDEEAKQKRTSDQVISVGLLPNFPGARRNYPTFKFGHISTKPDETVPAIHCPDGSTKFLQLWLLSINLMPGTSGSPILFTPEGANGTSFGGGRVVLLGLQSSAFFGADVSGMTPAKYIFEAIENLKIQDANLYRGDPPVPPKKEN
jgi:hypothetical protein